LEEVGFIVNPAAGSRGLASKVGETLLKDRDLKPNQVVFTKHRGYGIEAAEELCRRGARYLGVVGGDGTVHEVANGLIRSGVECLPFVVIIPVGSGNDIAANLGISRLKSLERLKDYLLLMGEAKSWVEWLDLIKIEAASRSCLYGVNVFSFGFSAAVAHTVAEKRIRNRLVYITSGLPKVWGAQTFPLVVNGSAIGSVLDFYVSSGPRMAGIVNLEPTASMKDGKFEVTLVPDTSRLHRFWLVAQGILGKLRKNHHVVVMETDSLEPLTLTLPVEMQGQIDGEPYQFDHGEISINVEHQKLPVVVTKRP